MLGAHEGGHFLVDDLDDLLGRGEAFQHLLAGAALGDRLAEVLDNFVVDVGFQKRHADFLHGLLDGGLGQFAAARQLGERPGKLLTESFKCHGPSPPVQWFVQSGAGPERLRPEPQRAKTAG